MKNEWLPIETAPRDARDLKLRQDGKEVTGFFNRISEKWYDEDLNQIDPTHWMDTGAGIRIMKKATLNY